MKRFIDLRGQIYHDDEDPIEQREPVFAFYCTVKGQFETFCGTQDWESKSDFIQDAQDAGLEPGQIERLVGLMPDWVPDFFGGEYGNDR